MLKNCFKCNKKIKGGVTWFSKPVCDVCLSDCFDKALNRKEKDGKSKSL